MAEVRPHVVVAGGGVIGLTSAAALLARDPRLSVTVLERRGPGDGATGFAGAMDIPFFRTPFERELVEASWAWHEAHGARATAYRRPVPMTWLVEPGLDLASRIATPLAEGPAPGQPPGWRTPEGTRPLHGPSFVIDPRAWCRALAGELARSGRGELVERAEVVALEPGPGGATQVRCADGRSLAADHVVLALGPWLPGWDERTRGWAAGIGLRTKRVFGLNVVLDESAAGRCVIGWPGADVYLHPAPAGGEHRLSLRHDEWDVDPDGEHRMVDAVLERGGAFLDRVVGAGRWSVVGHRIFVDSYTPEFQAVVGSCRALGEGVTLVTGTHGSGVRLAPGLAELAARDVIDRLQRLGQRGVPA